MGGTIHPNAKVYHMDCAFKHVQEAHAFARQMKAAEQVMEKDKELLKKLAE